LYNWYTTDSDILKTTDSFTYTNIYVIYMANNGHTHWTDGFPNTCGEEVSGLGSACSALGTVAYPFVVGALLFLALDWGFAGGQASSDLLTALPL